MTSFAERGSFPAATIDPLAAHPRSTERDRVLTRKGREPGLKRLISVVIISLVAALSIASADAQSLPIGAHGGYLETRAAPGSARSNPSWPS
jgi:hypothetical protein